MFRKRPILPVLWRQVLLACCALLLVACSGADATPAPQASPAVQGKLTPYSSPSPAATRAPTRALSATETPPPPSATPVTHTVKQGEDLSGLALRYGIDLAELIAANPTVNPRAMSVGTVLIIPPSKTPMLTGATAQAGALQTPTPIPIALGPLRCTRSRDGGIWCFQAAQNNQEFAIESLTGVIHLRGGDGKSVSQNAALPLDILYPGETLPLAAYFAPETAAGLVDPILGDSELHTALPYRDDGRYIPSRAENQKVFLSPDGLSADVTLDVALDANSGAANRVWVAAVAYDRQENIVGVRRWEKAGDDPLAAGSSLPVTLHIYSTGEIIARVAVISEARP